jgi:hypothetical protein
MGSKVSVVIMFDEDVRDGLYKLAIKAGYSRLYMGVVVPTLSALVNDLAKNAIANQDLDQEDKD